MRFGAAIFAFATASIALAQPRIESVSPAQGPIAGGTIVTVRGSGFTAANVRLDGATVQPLAQSDSEIRLSMPKHNNGYVVISVRGANAIAFGEFLYVPPRLEDLPPGYITTVAGVGKVSRDYGPALNATVTPSGVAFAPDGTLYIAESGSDKVSRVRTDGTIERVTAAGFPLSDEDIGDGGPAIDAHVIFPLAIALDPAGNLYIPDHSHRIRRVDAVTGRITSIAGNGVPGFSGDGGVGTNALINTPTHIAADGEDVFFIDFQNSRIRRIHLADGVISTFAGTGVAGDSGDGGLATSAQFNTGDSDQGYLALDPAGNLYLADSFNRRIRRIDRATRIITTFYKPTTGSKDDTGGLRSLAFDRDGNLYYSGSGRIVKVAPNGTFVRSFGNGTYALPIEGSPEATTGLGHVIGLAIASNGDIVFGDDAIGRVRRIDVAHGTVHTVAGIGPQVVGENGPANAAYSFPNDVAVDRNGNVLIAETLRLRRLDRGGNIITIGGTGSFVGRFAPAPMNQVVIAPTSVTAFADGSIEMTDLSVIDHVDPDGTLHWIAGRGGVCDYTGDGGPATLAAVCQAWDSTRDASGNLFIADSNNNRIRRVDAATGIMTTIVGNGGPVSGYERYGSGTSCGDGGRAFDACINTPYGVAFDDDGNLFISERPAIRKVDRSGTISTFANRGNTTKLRFHRGFLYASQIAGVFRLDRNGDAMPLAGVGGGSASEAGFDGDGGPALAAHIYVAGQAAGIAIDAEGNLYFCANERIRAVRYGAVLAPPNARIETSATGSTIRATVRDALGRLAPSVRVEFSAPATGASCSLANSFAITDANGVASVTCTPNCIAGTYAVTARPLTASAIGSVTLTNAAGPCRRRAVPHG